MDYSQSEINYGNREGGVFVPQFVGVFTVDLRNTPHPEIMVCGCKYIVFISELIDLQVNNGIGADADFFV